MEDETMKYSVQDVNDRLYDQIVYAETKNAIFVGLFGAAIFAVISLDPDGQVIFEFWKWYFLGVLAIGLGVTLLSFMPQTGKTNSNQPSNPYFWKDIMAFVSVAEYRKAIDQSQTSIESLLMEQNLYLAAIVNRKHVFFKSTLAILFGGIFPPFFLFLFFKFLESEICKRKGKSKSI
jgi:hypothetical protein